MTPPENIRKHFAEWISLLADPDAQLRYEKDVPFVPAHTELIETFYDLYTPTESAFVSAFTKEEAMGLATLKGLLDAAVKRMMPSDVHSVIELQELPEWQPIVRQAQAVHEVFQKR